MAGTLTTQCKRTPPICRQVHAIIDSVDSHRVVVHSFLNIAVLALIDAVVHVGAALTHAAGFLFKSMRQQLFLCHGRFQRRR